ncbi:MAG: type IV pilin [Hadesarchaea archaeon]|nr:type IV pilin [Hadesarchaea archaeon]
MRERGLSPIIATVLLISITVMAATPVAWYLAGYRAPFRPRRTDLAVYAGLINENIVRFHIQHLGGETITFERDKPTTDKIRAWAVDPDNPRLDNELYCWTFENPSKFRQSDWAYAEVQLHGAGFVVGDTIQVRVIRIGGGLLYDGVVTINSMDQIPGG